MFHLFPTQFPSYLQYWKLENNVICYEFERLIPSQKYIDDCLNLERSLIPFLKFSFDCLFALHILHERIGVIHCDISPSNIMYSEIDGVFKLFDFNLSIKKEDVALICRPGIGTKDFIAPESAKSGFYNEASDVYSLGMVIFSQFICIIDYLDVDESLSTEFIRIVAGMISPDPQYRLSVVETISELLSLSEKIIPTTVASNVELGPNFSSANLLNIFKELKSSAESIPGQVNLKIQPSALQEQKEVVGRSISPSMESRRHEMQL